MSTRRQLSGQAANGGRRANKLADKPCAVESSSIIPGNWDLESIYNFPTLFKLKTSKEVRAYIKSAADHSPVLLCSMAYSINDSFGRALQREASHHPWGWVPTKSAKSDIKLFECRRTLDILAAEILSQDKPHPVMLQHLFLSHPEKETLKKIVDKLFDAHGTEDGTLEILGVWRAFMFHPIPTYWSFACPEADAVLGEAVLERPDVLARLIEVAKLKPLPPLDEEHKSHRFNNLLGAVSAISDDLALLTDFVHIMPQNCDSYRNAETRVAQFYRDGKFDSVSDPRMLTALFRSIDDSAAVRFVLERLLFTENEMALYSPIIQGCHGRNFCKAVSIGVLARFDPENDLHFEIARNIVLYPGSDNELYLAARGVLSSSKDGRHALAEIAAFKRKF
ncbi:MAG: hypothetical protein WCT31_05095 [Candidatus Micrarchaeia archaeon]